jgi:hypothetical protein
MDYSIQARFAGAFAATAPFNELSDRGVEGFKW